MTDSDWYRREMLGTVVAVGPLHVTGSAGERITYRYNTGVDAQTDTAIAAENSLDGDSGWEPAHLSEGIEAYTTKTSVDAGEPQDLCVSADAPYDIDVYRLGWYDGDGARQMDGFPGDTPRIQPTATYSGPHDMVRCDWEVTDTIETGEDWMSGLYYAWVKETDGNRAYGHPFVVTNPEPSADIAVQLPMATQQAYNGWPGTEPGDGGKSLYGFNSDGMRGFAVSHDRPYLEPFNHHLNYATHAIRWLESEGYDVEYLDDLDVHRDPDRLQAYEAAVSAGHDEYWSINQHDAFTAARDSGVDLAFLGANICYWRIHYADDGRSYICAKDEEQDLFRNIGRHEAELLGIASYGYQADGNYPDMHVDPDGLDHPYMAETGFTTENHLPGIVGHEWAWIHPESPDNLTRFFHYEEGSQMDVKTDADADTVTYKADSGAQVFHCGTTSWPWRLDPDASWDTTPPYTDAQQHNPAVAESHEGLQQLQRNVFEDMLGD